MTLDEFENEVRATLEGFCQHWRETNKLDPDDWPLEMEGGDWWHHFSFYEIGKTHIPSNTGE